MEPVAASRSPTAPKPALVVGDPFEALWPVLAPLFAANPAALLFVGVDGRILHANHGPRGEEPAALVGKSYVALLPGEHRERASVTLDRVMRTREPARIELGEHGPGGVTSWSSVLASPVVLEGQTQGALLVVIDETSQKKTEERLRRSEALMVDAQGVAHMGTWEWDPREPHATWSAELYRIYGLTPEEYTPSYEAYLQKVHPDDRQRVMEATEGVFKRFVPYSHDERIFRPDGTMRWLHTWAVPILDEHGKLVRLVGVCQDVTEQKRAEGAMRAQTLTRSLARRLLGDLMRRANVPPTVVREVGRSLVEDGSGRMTNLTACVEAFADMGLGELRFDRAEGGRYTFSGNDLLERRADQTQPTCFATLGYLEGVVAAITGKRALGNEMRCQSMGHKECVFVVAQQ